MYISNAEKVRLLTKREFFSETDRLEDFIYKDGLPPVTEEELELNKTLIEERYNESILIAPDPITKRQVRKLLLREGKLNQVENILNNIPDETERAEALIDWECSTEYQADHPLSIYIASLIGYTTKQQRYQAWEEASKI